MRRKLCVLLSIVVGILSIFVVSLSTAQNADEPPLTPPVCRN